MTQTSMWDFQKNDNPNDFANLSWESPYIRAVDFESEEGTKIFSFKRLLSCSRVPVPKKNKLLFRVNLLSIIKDDLEMSWEDCNDFSKEELAREHFDSLKQETEFFHKRDKENFIFDGRRYMWEVKDDKLTGKNSW